MDRSEGRILNYQPSWKPDGGAEVVVAVVVGDRRCPHCILLIATLQVGDCQKLGIVFAPNLELYFEADRIVVDPVARSVGSLDAAAAADCSSPLPRLGWGNRSVRPWEMLNRYGLDFGRQLPERQDHWHSMPAWNDFCDVSSRYRRA